MTLTPPTGDRVTAVRFALVPISDLREHEEVRPERVAVVERRLVEDGVVRQPVVVDEGTMVVLDGHHRFNALRRLGATRVPAYLVDYRDGAITVESWDPARAPPTKDEVVARARAGKPFPPKSTKHPTLYGFAERPVPLSELGVG